MPRMITVDFQGVEVGGGRVHIPEGDYGVKLSEVVGKKGESSGKNYLAATFEVTQGDKKGVKKTLAHSFSLQKQSLWNLRNFLEACGKQVKAAAIKIDLDKLVGLECACTVTDDEYEGKKKSVISAFFPLEDLGSTSASGDELEEAAEDESGEEEVEEKPKTVAKKSATNKPAAEEEESSEEDLFS